MLIFVIILGLISLWSTSAAQKTEIINGTLCAHLYCPENCNLTYVNDCPHNCNCGPKKECPPVQCDYPFPRCLTLTQWEGCQTCICTDPKLKLDELPPPPGMEFRNTGLAKKRQCTPDYQFKLNVYYDWLYKKLYVPNKSRTLVLPSAFWFTRDELENSICPAYAETLNSTDPDVFKACLPEHQRLNMVYRNLLYVCGEETKNDFFIFHKCLADREKQKAVKLCEKSANSNLENKVTEEKCGVYDVLNFCVYDTVTSLCGYDGWETFYKVLALNIPDKFQNCVSTKDSTN